MPLVSVIIPTYRHQEYVLQTLESVWAQTFTDYEVIVINDGSPDNTAELLRPLAEAGRITYIEQPNAGQAAARNRGLAEASGEFIAFLDDDDLWPPDKLEWQVQEMGSDPSISLVGGTCIGFVDKPAPSEVAVVSPKSITFESMFNACPFTSPGQTLIRRTVLGQIGGFDATIWGADDLDLYMRLAQKGNIIIRPEMALYYRVHASNASKDLGRMLRNRRKVIRKNLPYVPKEHRLGALRATQFRFFRDACKLWNRGHRLLACWHMLHLPDAAKLDGPKHFRGFISWAMRRAKNALPQ